MRSLLSIAFFVAVLSIPSAAFAQNFFGPIVPQCGAACQMCDLVQMGDNIIRFLISIFAVIGAILVAWAGLLMATSRGDTGQLGKGKSILMNTVLGFIIMLVGWLIVDTVLKTLAGNQAYGMWQKVQCVTLPTYGDGAQSLVSETGMDELIDDPGYAVAPAGNAVLSDAAIARLQAQGIDVKSGASLNGVQSHVIDRVIALNTACGCDITITEGTGGTHAQGTYSHSNGYKLDLRTNDNPELVNYVKQNATFVKNSTYGPIYKSGSTTYLIEDDHLDVQFVP